jgi:adenosine kinase
MKLLGADPLILGTVGQDFGDYRRWLEDHGLRTDQIIEIADEFTASFFVSTDLDQNQIANFYTGAMAHARNISLAERGLVDAEVVIISPNDPQAMLNYANECRALGIPFAYDPSQQIARLSGDDLRQSIPGAAFLMVNEYEAAITQEKTGWTLDQIRAEVDTLVITEGKLGSMIYRGDEAIRVPVATPHHIAEPTGAGDGYRAGFLAAWSADLPLDVCGRVGALCSTYVLEQVGTSSHRFNLPEFIARYAENFGPEPRLSALG